MSLQVGDIFTARVLSLRKDLKACFAMGPDGEKVFVPLNRIKRLNRQDYATEKMIMLQLKSETSSQAKQAKASPVINVENHHVAVRFRGEKILGQKLQTHVAYIFPNELDKDLLAKLTNFLDDYVHERSDDFNDYANGPVELVVRTRGAYCEPPKAAEFLDSLFLRAKDLIERGREVHEPVLLEHIETEAPAKEDEDVELGKQELPSGGHYVIEKTEACYTIDVNSGIAHASTPDDLVRVVNTEAVEYLCKFILDNNLRGLFVLDFAGNLKEDLIKKLCHEISLKLGTKSPIYVNYELRLSVAIFSRGH